jgi:AraC-like DNA-binding protein
VRQFSSFSAAPFGNVVVTRWADDANSRTEDVAISANRYIISIAMKSTRLAITRGSATVFDGTMPAGTLHLGMPSSKLRVTLLAPFDFIHFHVPVGLFDKHDPVQRSRSGLDVNEFVLLRDSFAGHLCKALQKHSGAADSDYVHSIGQTLVMHVARMGRMQSRANALPGWRLKLVLDYIRLNIEESVTLANLADVAGLSRMHFAAQFRAATDLSPREFLLHARVEHAKQSMTDSSMPLAEVALAAGFRSQAHFSTVFKRIVHDTPGRWRQMQKSNRNADSKPRANALLQHRTS